MKLSDEQSLVLTDCIFNFERLILPGQRMANGTRKAPSKPANNVAFQGPAKPCTVVSTVKFVLPALSPSGPLSAVKIKMVLSATPSSSNLSNNSPVYESIWSNTDYKPKRLMKNQSVLLYRH